MNKEENRKSVIEKKVKNFMNDSFLNENLLVYPNDPSVKESNELLESLGNVLPINIGISITQTHTYYVIKMFTKSL